MLMSKQTYFGVIVCLMSFFCFHFVGESPSSSASDVDNLNNSTTVDKVAIAKGVTSPQVTANHVISGQNRTSYVRMLHFVSI